MIRRGRNATTARKLRSTTWWTKCTKVSLRKGTSKVPLPRVVCRSKISSARNGIRRKAVCRPSNRREWKATKTDTDLRPESRSLAGKKRADGPLLRSDSEPFRWRLGEQRHDLAREAAQALAASGAATRATAVDQHVTNSRFAQRLEPVRDLVGCSVDCADLVDYARITGGAVRPAMNGAVRPCRQFQLAHPVLQSPLHRRFLFGPAVGDEKRPGDPTLHWIEAPSGCFYHVFVYRDRLADIRRRGVLAEQQIVTLLRYPSDRGVPAGAHPNRRGGLFARPPPHPQLREPPIPPPVRQTPLSPPPPP